MCIFCKDRSSTSIEDEKHFMLHCIIIMNLNERKKMHKQIESIMPHYTRLTSDQQFLFLMTNSNGDSDICNLVAKFITTSMEMRESEIALINVH